MKATLKPVAGLTALSLMTVAHLIALPAAYANDAVIADQSKTVDSFTSYHGAKPESFESVLAGIKKPESGSQGNHDPEWKGFYTTDNKHAAAGYTVSDESVMTGKAGGVVKVTYPGKTRVLAVKPLSATELKTYLGLAADKPLIDQLNNKDFINKFGEGASRVVLQMPFADGTSDVEYIHNWEDATQLQVATEVRFDNLGKRGQDEMNRYMNLANCPSVSAVRVKRNPAKLCLSKVKWEQVREKSKKIIDNVKDNPEFMKKLSAHHERGSAPTTEKITALHNELLDHESFSALKGARSSAGTAATAASAAAWGLAVAQAFTNPKADDLTKATAVLSAVPGLGQALGIADGIKHHNTEEIVVQSISLTALIAAQAIPVVGELVDFGLLAYQLVESIIDLTRQLSVITANPPTEVTHSSKLAKSNGLLAGWKTDQDGVLSLGAPHGMKTQLISMSAEKGQEIPFTGAMIAVKKDLLTVNTPRVFVVQNGIRIPLRCSAAGETLTFCRPNHPVWLSEQHQATLHLSYVTQENESEKIDNPTVDILGQKIVDNKVSTANKVSLVYEVDRSNKL